MLTALQIDIYESSDVAAEVWALQVDAFSGYPYPTPRHLFFGLSQDDAEERFVEHTRFDSSLRKHVQAGAFNSRWKKVPVQGQYPAIRHIFYGPTEDDAEDHFTAHCAHDKFLKSCVENGSFKRYQCDVVTAWREVDVDGDASFAVA